MLDQFQKMAAFMESAIFQKLKWMIGLINWHLTLCQTV